MVKHQDRAKSPRLFMRSEWRVAAVGLAVVAILLASIGASALWADWSQRASLRQARTEQVRAVGAVLAQSAEALLASNELSSLRRTVAETARNEGLSQCRIVLPDGQVVADALPSHITLKALPEKWSEAVARPDPEGDRGVLSFPLWVAGRGTARLEMVAGAASPIASTWQAQAGMGAICTGALVATLVLYRRVRSRLRGLLAIQTALLARDGGQTSPAALEVDPTLGLEATAWNSLLAQEDGQRKQAALERTKEVLQVRRSYTEHLAVACDALSQGLILVGKDLRAEYVNGAASALLQTKRDDMLSAEISSFIHDDRILSACRVATTGPMARRTIVEVQRNNADGITLLRFVVRPVRREDWGVAMIIIEDITQQRVAEESRHAFVAQVTHELRTPLTNIRLYAEMAMDEGKKDPAVVANCLNVINQESFRLDRLVGDILSIAEIEAGTMSLKKDDVRLDEIFPELKNDYLAQAEERQIKLLFNLPPKLPVLKGDRDKLRLALHNLLGNALKYTLAGGQVTVTATVEQRRFLVEVSDTGIGIRQEDCHLVFEKFYRAKDERVAKIKGSGLGLTIAREVVRLHGGDITVQSEPDKGSTFTLSLPVLEGND